MVLSKKQQIIKAGLRGFIVTLPLQVGASANLVNPSTPNVILINCDDLGWGEVSCYGSPWKTPNIDALSESGVRFTSFYSGNAFSTPSRASLLTGAYAYRTGFREVLFNTHDVGLNPDEYTMAEMFRDKGYATACVGKWHLGNKPKFLPLNHGFDVFYGIPYSHDMLPTHPHQSKWNFPELPLIEGSEIIDEIKDISILTNIFTQYSVNLIKKQSKRQPLFLYLAHPMPHTPLAVTKPFEGVTGHGLIGDVIAELDWSVGEIIKALKSRGMLENTIVIFTSDNGSPRDNHDPGPFRGGKGTTFEGGQRVPFIISWPGVIPANRVNNEMASQMDLLPTFAAITGGKLSENKIDGLNILDLLLDKEGVRSPHKALFFFLEEEQQAARFGNYKYHVPHTHITRYRNEKPPKGRPNVIGESLFDLSKDPKESVNILLNNEQLTDSIRYEFLNWKKQFFTERRKIGEL